VGKQHCAVFDQEPTFMAAGKVYCSGVGQVSETICETIDDELHLKGIEKLLSKQ